MKRKLIETGKNILIAVLLLILIVLMVASLPTAQIRQTPWLSEVLQPLAPILGLPEAEFAYVETALPIMDAAAPVTVSVNNDAGRYTAMWDDEEIDRTFENLGGVLAQALDTASDAQVAELHQLTRALSGTSVCYCSLGSLPADLLAAWLDARPAEPVQMEVSSLALASEDGETALYLVGKRILRAKTEVPAETLEHLLSEYIPDGSRFAYETDTELSPLSVLPGSARLVRAVGRTVPLSTKLSQRIAADLGFNPYGDAAYTDADGDTYYTEIGGALHITAQGLLTLTSTSGQRFAVPDRQPGTLAEEGRRLVELTAGDTLGDARVYLTDIETENEKTVLEFAYVINGIAVEGAGARVTFTGNAVTELRLQLATYTVRSLMLHFLPPVQAAAILPGDADLRLIYSDTGANQLTAGWKKPE